MPVGKAAGRGSPPARAGSSRSGRRGEASGMGGGGGLSCPPRLEGLGVTSRLRHLQAGYSAVRGGPRHPRRHVAAAPQAEGMTHLRRVTSAWGGRWGVTNRRRRGGWRWGRGRYSPLGCPVPAPP